MPAITITNELINESFELAYFILGDRPAAVYVAMSALDKLKAAATAQGQRLYYTPTGRSAFPATRTKVSLSKINLLQRLIYVESEPFERLLEEQSLSEEDLIIRYIKHLIRITTKHNSFYVTLGLCRLLYNYTTSETAELYSHVLQDPVRMRDHHYYRSRKKRLMQELQDRFENLLRTQQGFRREERFHSEESSARFAVLVEQALIRFTPWRSDCVLPTELDPKRNVVATLFFKDGDPDLEHEIELNRIHTVIHPTCFVRLTTALGLDHPDHRLSIPRFFISGGSSRSTEDRLCPKVLNEGELRVIRRYLDKNSFKRKTYVDTPLICLVDRNRQAVFEPQLETNFAVTIPDGSEMVEIRAVLADEEVPLALCPIAYGPTGIAHSSSSIVIEGGSKLTFTIAPSPSTTSESADALVSISCQPSRASPGKLSPMAGFARLFAKLRAAVPSMTTGLRPAVAVLVIAVFAAGLWGLLRYQRRRMTVVLPAQQERAKVNELPSPVSEPSPREHQSGSAHGPERQRVETPLAASSPPPSEIEPSETNEETRGRLLRPEPSRLSSVKRVYVEQLGHNNFSRQLREWLMTGLQSSHHFTVVSTRNDAEAVFRGSLRPAGNGGTLVTMKLVDASGQMIWTLQSGKSGRRFASPAEASAQILQSLLNDLRAAEGGR